MAIEVKHRFVSPKGDGTDATLLRPSNWNDTHDIEMASNKMLGRLTAGPGDAEELPLTAYMSSLLGTATFEALAIALGLPTTADAKLTFKTVADTGWLLMNDSSFGDAGSGATQRQNADCLALFTHFFNNMSDAAAPIQTSAGVGSTRAAQGGSAGTAWANKCRMVLPRQLGRAIIVAGTGIGLTARPLGSWAGEEGHVMTVAEMPVHGHTQQGTFAGSGSGSGSISGTGSGTYSGNTAHMGGVDHLHTLGGFTGTMSGNITHSHTSNAPTKTLYTASQADGPFGFPQANTTATIDAANIDHQHSLPATTGAADRSLNHSHTCSGSISVTSLSGSCSVSTINVNTTLSGATANNGSGSALNIMQPYTAWNIMIKL